VRENSLACSLRSCQSFAARGRRLKSKEKQIPRPAQKANGARYDSEPTFSRVHKIGRSTRRMAALKHRPYKPAENPKSFGPEA
jgi:hypothetical protein